MTGNKRGLNTVFRGASFTINSLFLIVSIACLLPLFLILSVSITDEKTIILNGYQFIPAKFSFSAYEFLFMDLNRIVKAYWVTFQVTTIGSMIGVTIMALYAYPISRTEFPHRKFFTFYVFFTILFNGGLVPWYLVYTKMLHLKDNIWALIVPMLVAPFFVLIFRTFFQGIPKEILESATMDGASEFRIFWKIVMPLSLPVLATISLFTMLNYWNDWFMSLVFISSDQNVSLQYLMYKTMLNIQYLTSNTQAYQGISQGGTVLEMPKEAVRMAMAVIGIGPMIFAYPFFQRYFVQGLTVGAIKG
jgi:putative aldouronate transport system permease protein